ncbi:MULTISPECIES: hypothetical protein [Actinomycetes]|uniref:hypothetical protein n=1 Tax=Micromonospora sp. NPDC005367 TaxID=3155590 RepID=UPI0033A95F2F
MYDARHIEPDSAIPSEHSGAVVLPFDDRRPHIQRSAFKRPNHGPKTATEHAQKRALVRCQQGEEIAGAKVIEGRFAKYVQVPADDESQQSDCPVVDLSEYAAALLDAMASQPAATGYGRENTAAAMSLVVEHLTIDQLTEHADTVNAIVAGIEPRPAEQREVA